MNILHRQMKKGEESVVECAASTRLIYTEDSIEELIEILWKEFKYEGILIVGKSMGKNLKAFWINKIMRSFITVEKFRIRNF